ncbi:MAG TPA: helix-turn-helix domain-containing protein [Sphingomicrobium sp.]|nr:helix-turn-helix domain-containing protein [Sphingomicrobium sp.]
MIEPDIAHGDHCPAELALDFLAGKWRPMIIYWLMDGPLRFNELQRRLGSVTHRTLSKALKEMEDEKLLVRKDYGEIPPRVDYRLTELGQSLRPVLKAMEAWANANRELGREP